MSNIKEHILYKSIIMVLVLALLAPSMVKLAHVFENHKHEVCKVPQKLHYHDYELDCEFYKFKLSPQIHVAIENPETIDFQDTFLPIISQYEYISDYQRLPFSLRGPPSLV